MAKTWDEMNTEEQEAARQRTAEQVDQWLTNRNARAAEAPNMLIAPVRELPRAIGYSVGDWKVGSDSNGRA